MWKLFVKRRGPETGSLPHLASRWTLASFRNSVSLSQRWSRRVCSFIIDHSLFHISSVTQYNNFKVKLFTSSDTCVLLLEHVCVCVSYITSSDRTEHRFVYFFLMRIIQIDICTWGALRQIWALKMFEFWQCRRWLENPEKCFLSTISIVMYAI